MQYDPIKRSLGKVFNQTPALRVLFYKMLDLLLLRAWHIAKELRCWQRERNETGKGGAEILDAGSGFGQYTYRMAKLNKANRVLGVDVKEEQIADCNDFFAKLGLKERVSFAEADLTKFEKADSYDLVLSVDVMEHILEDERVFGNFYKSMKKGGMLLISTPSDLGGSDAEEHEEGEMHGFIDEHVRDGYNIDDIKAKLQRAGFVNVDARYSYGRAGHASWLMSMKWPILALGATKLFYVLLPFYYVVTFPLCLVLNVIDVCTNHKAGTGLIVKCYK